MSKEIFNIESRYSSEIKFSSANYDDFDGTNKNDFILFLIKKNFNLRGSNLSGSDLRGSDLSHSNLSGSDLRGSNLSGSNLSHSNLSGSDLRGSNLSGSNLSGSNLSGSDLRGSKMPIYSKWNISIIALIPLPKLITDYEIKIGCKQKSIENWDIWFSGTDTFDTPRNTESFIRINAQYIATREYLKFLCDGLAKLEAK